MSLNFSATGFSITLRLVSMLADAGPAQAGVEHLRRRRVVEIRGDAAGHRQGRVGEHAADRRRQQQADVFFIGREHVPQQQPPQDERARPAACRR